VPSAGAQDAISLAQRQLSARLDGERLVLSPQRPAIAIRTRRRDHELVGAQFLVAFRPAQSAESWGRSDLVQKITFAEMRAAGVRCVLVYCYDYRCSHSICLDADRWSDDIRLSDIEPAFVCAACGRRGADIRPD
jgi:hypothetical protein